MLFFLMNASRVSMYSTGVFSPGLWATSPDFCVCLLMRPFWFIHPSPLPTANYHLLIWIYTTTTR